MCRIKRDHILTYTVRSGPRIHASQLKGDCRMKRSQPIVAIVLFSIFAAMPRISGQVIAVTSTDYRSDVRGTTSIRVNAVGYSSPLEAKSWLPGGKYGSDSTVASISLDGKGSGSFDFPADR